MAPSGGGPSVKRCTQQHLVVDTGAIFPQTDDIEEATLATLAKY
jgi:hypothetical protein